MESTQPIQSSWTYAKKNQMKEWAKNNPDKIKAAKKRWRERQKEKNDSRNNEHQSNSLVDKK